MRPTLHHFCALGFAALLVLSLPQAAEAQAQRRVAQSGAFEPLIGSWSGEGTISLGNGSRERVRCVATYAQGNDQDNLVSQLRCAGDSFKFEINTDIVNRGGQISGTWLEATRSVTGTLSGTVNAGTIQGKFESAAFSASLSVAVQGKRQTATLSSPGSELSGASIALSRR